jgi:hypothetical protein
MTRAHAPTATPLAFFRPYRIGGSRRMLWHSGGRYFLVAITCLLASQHGGTCVVDLTPHGCGRNVGALQARPARVAFIMPHQRSTAHIMARGTHAVTHVYHVGRCAGGRIMRGTVLRCNALQRVTACCNALQRVALPLQRAAARTGLRVVMATGFGPEGSLPPLWRSMDGRWR